MRGIKDGSWVKLSSRVGETIMHARITDSVPAGVVYTTFHFPESGANVITTDFSDWATNCPEYKVTAVEISPSEKGPAVIHEHDIAGDSQLDSIIRMANQIAAIMDNDAGTYFLTDFLVKSFHRSVIVELGLDKRPDLRDDYFKHYNKILWLAQNPTPELNVMAEAAADLIGLKLEIDVVGEGSLKEQILELLN